MRCSRKLATLALSAVAALPFGVTANATPATASASMACNPEARSYISNQGTVGIGVVEAWRGYGNLYAMGLYTKVLPVGQRTDCAAGFQWAVSEGYYIGPGYCAVLRTPNSQNNWVVSGRVGPGPLQLKREDQGRSVERWEVNAFPAGSSQCTS